MTKMPKTHYYVHCHLCVLKEKCDFAAPDESYRYQHSEFVERIPHEVYAKLNVATNNCPILKALKYLGFM